MKTFNNLVVWQRSVGFATSIYSVTEKFPRTEIYGLTNQLRRAAVSVGSNIAEGSKRGSYKEFLQFLRIAQGSGAEIETQLTIARNLKFISDKDFTELLEELNYIMRMLTKLINSTKS